MITIQDARRARQQVTPVYNREGREGHIEKVSERSKRALFDVDFEAKWVPLVDLWTYADWCETFARSEQGGA